MSARGKGKGTRLRRQTAATALQQAIHRRGFAPLQIALSKARAARVLLAADADYLQIPVSLRPGDTEASVREWIQDFAFDALDAALEEAEAAPSVPTPIRQPRGRTARRRAA